MTRRSDLLLDPHHHASDLPKGIKLLHDPLLNKGTAFSQAERDSLGIHGLLPPRLFTQDEQVTRVMENVRRKPNNLEKYIYMIGLQDRNETLFYRVLVENLAELMPIIYTPTVGQACMEYGEIFRRARGLFITKYDRGHIREIMRNWPNEDVRMIVVTDGERILGLGDLGANGMGIPVGKLSLYTGCAGIHPAYTLPITLDVGTNNETLRNDPLYIGLQEPRLRGPEYDALIEEFIEAATEVFPRAVVQLEDFGNSNAFRLLTKYRDQVCLFDDDIQGTAAVVVAGLFSAMRITGGTFADHRFLFVGAGQANLGAGELLVLAMVSQGMSEKEARERCWFVDSTGLMVSSRTDLSAQKRPFAHEAPFLKTPLEAVEFVKPTALIGAAGQAKMFPEAVIRAMGKLNDRPIIFALSNPTSNSECSAEEAYTYTEGRAIFASGSPFPPFTYNGKTFVPGQGNNSYIFPGVGLGLIASNATRVPEEMFLVAAQTLAKEVAQEDLDLGRIYPPLNRVRDVSAKIAEAVANIAYRDGLTADKKPADLAEHIKNIMFQPVYQDYV
ncbi:MAG: NAD-dependent malic enzyme [Anaerolineae bacterium]|nr:NAD-dependent malic enzyme [Anaerolineae bacterium]